MRTLLLDIAAVDLALDINGNIAVAGEPYAIAQDVASAVRLFAGELYYDTSQGVRYFDVFGNVPNLQYVKLQLEKAALTVPGVVSARCLFASLNKRVLTGQVQIIDTTGASNNVTF